MRKIFKKCFFSGSLYSLVYLNSIACQMQTRRAVSLTCYIYLAQKLCFWTGIIFIRVYVSVCVCLCVCKSVYQLSQKVLDRFWWNLAGWCIMTKYRFLFKIGLIGLVKRIPRPFEMLKLPYFTKSSGKFLKT